MMIADSPKPEWTLTARWILPVDGPPLERGTITIRGERVVAVEPHGCRTADRDAGNAAILPGLVNAHTHLDLSGLRGKIAPTKDFTAWLQAVIAHRRSLSAEQARADILAGLAEASRSGTTLLGDISAKGLSWEVLASEPIRAVVFYELLGLPRTRAHQAWAEACAWLCHHPPTATCKPGLSPHAPYSVRGSLFRAAANRAGQQLPLAIHLAETKAELELLEQHRGPFVDFLTELGVWDPDGIMDGVHEVFRLASQVASVLYIHGNYLDAATSIPRGGTVVYCPRTHAAFGHDPHPLPALLDAGVRVALGTDSLASNPDLDMLAELRFVRQLFPEIPGPTLLRLATLSGAEALGWQSETGSLTAGKSADLVVMPLPPQDHADLHELLLDSSCRIAAVLRRGEWGRVGEESSGARL